MKQAQQMQEEMKRTQENTVVIGEASGGKVKVEMTGNHHVNRVILEPSLLKEEHEIIEDMLAAAFNNAVDKVGTSTRGKMSALLSGMDLPPNLKIPFDDNV
jgi:DNA-binding YbaB/EbfC family protein